MILPCGVCVCVCVVRYSAALWRSERAPAAAGLAGLKNLLVFGSCWICTSPGHQREKTEATHEGSDGPSHASVGESEMCPDRTAALIFNHPTRLICCAQAPEWGSTRHRELLPACLLLWSRICSRLSQKASCIIMSVSVTARGLNSSQSLTQLAVM